MRTLTENLPVNPDYFMENMEDITGTLFFDIETTGFSAKTSFLYLIGCAFWCPQSDSFRITQWFCETKNEEILVLQHFLLLLEKYSTVITYNGQGFDIPYLEKKCSQYGLSFDFSKVKSLDLYKQIQPYKNFLKLTQLKQKNIEEFLEIERDDIFNGGELISVYEEYLSAPDEKLLQTLLLHNSDDIRGLVQILPIISYIRLFQGDFSVSEFKILEESAEIIFVIEPVFVLPKRISYGNSRFYFTGFQNTAKLKIKLYTGELKYFYPNYRDYYYLPAEDCSIHKSVAFYVDKNYRTQAKAANCYSKKTGKFLPQSENIIKPYFKIEYKDSETFFEVTDDFLENSDLIKKYVLHILLLLSRLH